MAKRILTLAFILIFCVSVPVFAGPGEGGKPDDQEDPELLEGASATSIGRFGWWAQSWGDEVIWPDVWDHTERFRRFEQKWDGNLVARINFYYTHSNAYPLGLQKTVFSGTGEDAVQDIWGIDFFAWDDLSEVPIPVVESVDVESANWVSKTVAVRFTGDEQPSYRLSYNSVSPGVLLESDESYAFLGGKHGPRLEGMAGMTTTGVQYRQFPEDPAEWLDWYPHFSENWLLVWFDDEAPYQVPVLLVMSEEPARIHGSKDGLFVQLFKDLYNPTSRFVLSLPFGVEILDPSRVDAWNAGNFSSVAEIEQFRLISRLTSRWPVDVKEYFSIDREEGLVKIEDHFSYRDVADGWGATLQDYAPIPPVVTFAAEKGMPVEIVDQDTTTVYPTIYGELKIVEDSNISRWNIPLPPEHSLAYVGPPIDSEHPASVWRESVNNQIRLWTAFESLHWPYRARVTLNQDGTSSSLALTDAGVRDRFLNMVKAKLDRKMLCMADACDYATADNPAMWNRLERCGGICETAWREECRNFLCETGDTPEACTLKVNEDCGYLSEGQCGYLLEVIRPVPEWESLLKEACDNDVFEEYEFHIPLYDTAGSREVNGDIDVTTSLTLEALYEYGLWSGDWDYVESNWNKVEYIFAYLANVNDWAWMSSSARAWGECGAMIDMFPSHYIGYLSYARMAGILGKEEERDLGLYFAARSQIPLVARFAFTDEASKYFLLSDDPGRIVTGFGEVEPVMDRYGSADQVVARGTLDNVMYWADFTLSGERIHPLVYEVYDVLGTYGDNENHFKDLLDFGIDTNSSVLPDENNPFEYASFPVNKIYAFNRFGLFGFDEDAGEHELITRIGQMYTKHTSDSLTGLNYDGTLIFDSVEDLVTETSRREEIFGPFQIYMKYPWDPAPRVFDAWEDLKYIYPRANFPVLPALVESHGIPVKLGSWAPAVLTASEYEENGDDTGTFKASLRWLTEDATEAQVLKLILDGGEESVRDVRIDIKGKPVRNPTWSFDDRWSVLTINLEREGPWDVEIDLDRGGKQMFQLPEAGDGDNFIVNAGFEDCGASPNWDMAWYKGWTDCVRDSTGTCIYDDEGNYIWKALVYPISETGEAHLGSGASMKMETFEVTDNCSAVQRVHVGDPTPAERAYTTGVWYKVPGSSLPPETKFTLQFFEYEDVHLPGETESGYLICEVANNLGCSIGTVDGTTYHDCPDEWIYAECQGTLCENCTNIMFRIHLDNGSGTNTTVYVDDVSLAFDN